MVGINTVGNTNQRYMSGFYAPAPQHFPNSTYTPNSTSNAQGSGDYANFSNSMLYTNQATSTSDNGSSSDNADSNQSSHPGHGHGKNKSGQWIPPGLAKKNPADLPDGNPWKAVLEQQAKANQSNPASQAPDTSESNGTQTTQPYGSETALINQTNPIQLLEEFIQLIYSALASNGTPTDTSTTTAIGDPSATTAGSLNPGTDPTIDSTITAA